MTVTSLRALGARSDGGASRPRVAVVGDVVLDRDVEGTVTRLCPDAPVPVVDVDAVRESPGGAGLAALLCAGRADVVLVAPIADDEGGRALRRGLAAVELVALDHDGPTRRKTRVRSAGQSLVRVDDGGPGAPLGVDAARVRAALATCDAVLVADYGAGVTHDPVLREVLAEAARRVPVVWDPHPRGATPVPGVALATPNLAEAVREAARLELDAAAGDAASLAGALAGAWSAGAVAVTAGERGAFVAEAAGTSGVGAGVQVPAVPAGAGDPCGAGDRFAATAVEVLARGGTPAEAVREAVAAASAWVAAGGAEGYRRSAAADAVATSAGPAAPPERAPRDPGRAATPDELERLAARLRTGGTLVATGGCFDLVHAGHVATLESARALGDRLVVLVNSDASVRRLKGPGRPVVPAADRVRVLEALDCVDAAVVFDDDDPCAALELLRPDVWVKGGDYSVDDLPEATVVAAHGGRTVVVPYLAGRSTTSILERVESIA
jgi:rfaE bifunctional protein nucleotidyltransferase chain/domain/rfaE bifunctional protein kinase chain/domain